MVANNTDKPTILLVHGAWHPPQCYQALKDDLAGLGYECVAPQLPSLDSTGVAWDADVARILQEAETLFEQGKEVVMVAHSYGGIPGCIATEGQGVEERRRAGRKGGFQSIVFLTAFAIPQRGMDLLTTFGGAWPDWANPGETYVGKQAMSLNEKSVAAIYSDCEEAVAKQSFALTKPHSQDAFEKPAPFVAGDVTIPKAYVVCELDQVIPAALQDQLVASTPGMRSARLRAGHSPFISRRPDTAETLVKLVEEMSS